MGAIKPSFERNERLAQDMTAIRRRRKEISKEAVTLQKETLTHKDFGKEITITKKSIKEWLNQPHEHYAEKNELLLDIDKTIKISTYNGFITDKHDPQVKAHIFETRIKGDLSWIIVREFKDGKAILYSICDNNPKK